MDPESFDFVWPLAIFLIGTSLVSCVRFRTEYGGQSDSATCVQCNYSMDGLGDDALCPECGCATPRIRPDRARTVVSAVAWPPIGIACVGLIALLSTPLHPLIWNFVHPVGHCCRITFGDLDGETFLGAGAGAASAMVLYIVLLPFLRARGKQTALWLGIAATLGSLVGLAIATQDRRFWHGRTPQEVAMASCAAVLLTAAVLLFTLRSRRETPPQAQMPVN